MNNNTKFIHLYNLYTYMYLLLLELKRKKYMTFDIDILTKAQGRSFQISDRRHGIKSTWLLTASAVNTAAPCHFEIIYAVNICFKLINSQTYLPAKSITLII